MAYIRMDKDLIDDPRILRLADLASLNEILGGLYRLWRYADTYISKEDAIQLRYTDLERITGLALPVLRNFPPEWLRENPDGSITLPNYTLKNPLIDKEKRREQTRQRVANWRKNKRPTSNARGNALRPRYVTLSNERYTPLRNAYTETETGTTSPGSGTGIKTPASEPAPGTANAAPAPRPAALNQLLDDITRKRTLRAEPGTKPEPVQQARTAESEPRPEAKPLLEEEKEIRADAMRLQAMRRRYGIP